MDFVLCEPRTFAPRLVVELDDSSHQRADRRERDAFVDDVLASAGIPILHVRWQRRYDVRQLAQQIAAKLVPAQLSQAPNAPSAPAPPASAARPPTPPTPPTIVMAAQSVAAIRPTPLRRACGQCQSELREGAKFCAQCGAVFAL